MRILAAFLLFLSVSVFASPFTTLSKKDGLISNNVNCISSDKNFIWIGTDKGINRILFKNAQLKKVSPRRTSVPVLSILNDDKFLWVGLQGKGVYKMIKENYKFVAVAQDALGTDTIEGIHQVGPKVYFLTPKVIKVLSEGKVSTLSNTQANQLDLPLKFKALTSGRIFPNKGVSKINNGIVIKGDTLYNDNFENNSISFYQEFESHVLLSNKTGSYKYFPNTKTVAKYQKTINFKPFANKRWHGITLLCSNQGIVLYNKSTDELEAEAPTIQLKDCFLNGKKVDSIPQQLEWQDYTIGFQLTTLGFANNKTIKFQYKKVGSDKWVTVNNSLIEFNELESGDHNIRIRAINNLGTTAELNKVLSFSIESPTTDQVIYYGSVSLILITYTIVVVLIARRKYKKDITVLEAALIDKTNKLNKIEKSKYGLVEEDKVNI